MELVPTDYPLEYALNARLMWNKHGIFPNGKCYDEQDPALIDDIKRLNARFGYHVERLKGYANAEWGGEDDGFESDDTPATTLDQMRG